MEAIVSWVTRHPELVGAALALLVAALNAATSHYSGRRPWVVPVFGVLLEALSVLRSKDAHGSGLPGPLSRLKLPLQNVPPAVPKSTAVAERLASRRDAGSVRVGLVLMVFSAAGLFLLFANGCATSGPDLLAKSLAGAQRGGAMTFDHVRPRYAERCMAAAKACRVALPDCPGYRQCDADRHRVFDALKALQLAVVQAVDVLPLVRAVKEVSK